MKAPVVCFSHRFPQPPSLPPPPSPHAQLRWGKSSTKAKSCFSLWGQQAGEVSFALPPKASAGSSTAGKPPPAPAVSRDAAGGRGRSGLFVNWAKKRQSRPLPILLPAEDAAPEDGNTLGTVWGRATVSSRGFKTPIREKSGGNFGLLVLEEKDGGRCANSLQKFKGKL